MKIEYEVGDIVLVEAEAEGEFGDRKVELLRQSTLAAREWKVKRIDFPEVTGYIHERYFIPL